MYIIYGSFYIFVYALNQKFTFYFILYFYCTKFATLQKFELNLELECMLIIML